MAPAKNNNKRERYTVLEDCMLALRLLHTNGRMGYAGSLKGKHHMSNY